MVIDCRDLDRYARDICEESLNTKYKIIKENTLSIINIVNKYFDRLLKDI
jgi:hypothetical protein